jgi:DNA-binding NtrC family response regulator
VAQVSSKRILIVDDEPAVCLAIGELLRLDGHEVESTTTAEEAVELCKNSHFDLVFLDYYLSDTTGEELLGVFRRANPRQKIVIISGHRPYPIVGQADFLIRKPFTAEVIRRAIVRFA